MASGKKQRDPLAVTLSGLEVTAKSYQAELLEQLDAERVLHDRHGNLIVAATGTGKTVVAALDYRRLVREVRGRDLTLLLVAHRKEILTQARRLYQEVLTDPCSVSYSSTATSPPAGAMCSPASNSSQRRGFPHWSQTARTSW